METAPRPLAVVSGGLGDIGRAVAIELAARFEADVALCDLLPDNEAAPILAQFAHPTRRAVYARVDITEAARVVEWVAQLEQEFGTPPSLVICNAAQVTLQGIRDITPQQFSRELSVNVGGAFHLAQACVQRLLARSLPGRVVFVGSWAAHAVHSSLPAYCVSKAALRMLMQCLALDLAQDNILVNEVAPGYVDAGLSGHIFRDFPDQRERAARTVPNGQLIEAHEVARAVAHLCDPDTRHCVGSTFLLDGGLSLISPGYTPHV